MRNLGILSFFFLFFLSMSGIGQDNQVTIHRKGQYVYEIRNNQLEVKNISSGEIVYQYDSPERNTILLTADRSALLDSFIVIEETRTADGLYEIDLITESETVSLITGADSPIYTPVWFEYPPGSAFYLFYIDENFRITVFKVFENRVLRRLRFDHPIINLEISSNPLFLQFQKFHQGKYRWYRISIPELLAGNCLSFFPFDPNRTEFHPTSTPPGNPAQTIDVFPLLNLYGDQITGFGDSITYGYINREPAPQLGYVPRLQYLMDTGMNGERVINEGQPAETTVKALYRYENVLLLHSSPFLLFHEGTNDVIWPRRIPVSTTLFNISYMMDRALLYDMDPVLSTLIPRNGKYGEGIYLARALEICEGITDIAEEKGLPLVDLWRIFSDYPLSEGGYPSLMSDSTHPSEEGYQLMAVNWFEALHALIYRIYPPQNPCALFLDTPQFNPSVASRSIVLTWEANTQNKEDGFSVSHYRLYRRESGDAPGSYSLLAELSASVFSFRDTTTVSGTLYDYALSAVDADGNESEKVIARYLE